MEFKMIVMGVIVLVLGALYAATLWTEKNNKKLEKELKEKGIL